MPSSFRGNAPSDGGIRGVARRMQELATGSLRRRAQLLFLRPDLEFFEMRGNVETRLRKLDEGAWDGSILAEAGLDRLGLSDGSRHDWLLLSSFPQLDKGRWAWNAVPTT